MAEFYLYRDPMQQNSSLVLKEEKPNYGSEHPHNEPCRNCPVKNTAIPGGCTTLAYNSYAKDTRGIMPTVVETECGIINNPDNSVEMVNDDYDSLMATYEDKGLVGRLRRKVRDIMGNESDTPQDETETKHKFNPNGGTVFAATI